MTVYDEIPVKKTSYSDGSMASNTADVWRRLVGETIVGAFSTYNDGRTQIWLVTGSGAAAVFNENGAFWRASKEDVRREVQKLKEHLDRNISSLKDILHLATGTPIRASGCEGNCHWPWCDVCRQKERETVNREEERGMICGADDSIPFEHATMGAKCPNRKPCEKHDKK